MSSPAASSYRLTGVARSLVGTGTRLAPDDRGVCLALAQAYAAAGRSADVARARARLLALEARRGARDE
jgi:hypothetical protein